jgi:uncharacterized protein (DUF4415 family)
MRKEYDFSQGTRGAVVKGDPGKTRITIRLDEDVIDWFRNQVNAAGGGNYQTLINKALREYIGTPGRAAGEDASARDSRRTAEEGRCVS